MPSLYIGGASSYVGEAWIGQQPETPVSYHVLRQIRDAAETALDGLELANGSSGTAQAFGNRSDDQPLQDSELPAFRVRVREDDAAVSTFGNTRRYERTCQLIVEACVKRNATFEDDVYEMCRLAEAALTSLSPAKAVDIRRIEIEDDAKGEKPVAVGRMTFEVLYYTAIGAPDAAL